MPELTLAPEDWQAIALTAKLAAVTLSILFVIGVPLAWWLARTRSRLGSLVSALVAVPLVLPPTVLGFYLLVLLGPQGPVGRLTEALGLGLLPFSFPGLVVASTLFSLPFVVQPLQATFSAIGERMLEVAATLGAGPFDTFWHVVLPLSRPGLLSAAVLGFAHTLGEFGVVLMIGGNIPGRTQVLSIAIYNRVEAFEYAHAHLLAGGLLAFSFVALLALQFINRAGVGAPGMLRGGA
ncbi:MAG: molybdate ABC transporter permease subunit [Rhodocyclaceae bacterium]|nr:molybdate ABC transporter permease subunit [Rhodocyclaceae bacterium]